MMADAPPAGAVAEKHPRKRVRGLLKTLQDQIEFYFGDANLPKDKFLRQKIKDNPDGYVPIDVIAKFNKMKELTSELSLIVQAIRNSSMVELSVDEKSLRRCAPMPDIAQSDIDLRTVYVENLPSTPIDHDHVQKLFGVFGRVVYVSLPRHKVSGKLKGFGFVEFSTQEEAQNALEYFQSGVKPPPTPTTKKMLVSTDVPSQSEEEGGSPTAKREGSGVALNQGAGKVGDNLVQKRVSRKRKRDEEGSEQQDESLSRDENVQEEVSEGISRKRKREEEGSEAAAKQQETHVIKNERVEEEANVGALGKQTEGEEGSEAAVKQEDTNVTKESQDKGTEEEGTSRQQKIEEEVSDKKEDAQQEVSRKRKRTELEGGSDDEVFKKSARLESQSSDIFGGDHKKKKNRQHKKKDKWATLKEYNLKVLAKKEWLEMKQLYREMQKEQMKQLKAETHRKDRTEGKGFVSNCLIRVECEEVGEITVDSLRETCSKYGEVAFVDFEEGENSGYVRYRTSGCVEKVVELEKIPNVTFHAVGEEDEKQYYLKTQAARKQSWVVKQQGRKKKNMRGQDKVVTRALQRQGGKKGGGAGPEHIRFSDSDSDVVES